MLKIRFKDKRQEPVWVVEKVFTIGSAADNSLVIQDPSVQDYHARLLGEDGHFILQDTGSATGTFVNGQRVNQRHIGCHDTLRCGDVELEVVDPLEDQPNEDLPYWALIADAHWMAGQEFPLRPQQTQSQDRQAGGASSGDNTVLIGRGRDCDIVFPGTHLSREHAQMTPGRDTVVVRDLNSTTGTFVNDQRVKGTVEARAGDRIRLDIYSFTLLGPGMQFPQSTTHSLPNMGAAATGDDEPETPKQWKTRPTSPGNREELSGNHTNTSLLWLSVLLILTLILAAIYLLFN